MIGIGFVSAAIGVTLLFLVAGRIVTWEYSRGSSMKTVRIDFLRKDRKQSRMRVMAKVGILAISMLGFIAILLLSTKYFGEWPIKIYLMIALVMCGVKLLNRLVNIFGIGRSLSPFQQSMGKVSGWMIVLGMTAAWIFHPSWLTFDVAASAAVLWMLVSVSIANFGTAMITSGGVMIYDAISVFQTHKMIELVKATSGIPIMVMQPSSLSLHAQITFAMGLGDIVLPGLVVMFAFRAAKRCGGKAIAVGTILGYVMGLFATLLALHITGSPQPATIYLMPGVLIGYAVAAYATGQQQSAFKRDLVDIPA